MLQESFNVYFPEINYEKYMTLSRANYASVMNGNIIDRRAGRIQNTGDLSRDLETEIDGVKFIVQSGVEHRAAVVIRGSVMYFS